MTVETPGLVPLVPNERPLCRRLLSRLLADCTDSASTHWAPAQAAAVFEVLDELREWVWLGYGSQIQQELRRDRVATTSAVPSNLGDEEVPF